MSCYKFTIVEKVDTRKTADGYGDELRLHTGRWRGFTTTVRGVVGLIHQSHVDSQAMI